MGGLGAGFVPAGGEGDPKEIGVHGAGCVAAEATDGSTPTML